MQQRHAPTAGGACRPGGHQATALMILLFSATYVNCNNHCSIMVSTHAINAATKPEKHKAAKTAKISHRQLCPHGNSGSPQGNNTNLHIAKLNLNHLRFTNALVTLGMLAATSPPADMPPNPLDGADVPISPPDELPTPDPAAAGVPIGTGAVRINKTPPHDNPSNPNAPTQSTKPTQSILRKSTDTLQSQLNDSLSNNTQFSTNSLNEGKDKDIHDKSHKVLKEMTGGHLTKFHAKDFASLFPVWPIVKFALAPTGASKDKRMTQYV